MFFKSSKIYAVAEILKRYVVVLLYFESSLHHLLIDNKQDASFSLGRLKGMSTTSTPSSRVITSHRISIFQSLFLVATSTRMLARYQCYCHDFFRFMRDTDFDFSNALLALH